MPLQHPADMPGMQEACTELGLSDESGTCQSQSVRCWKLSHGECPLIAFRSPTWRKFQDRWFISRQLDLNSLKSLKVQSHDLQIVKYQTRHVWVTSYWTIALKNGKLLCLKDLKEPWQCPWMVFKARQMKQSWNIIELRVCLCNQSVYVTMWYCIWMMYLANVWIWPLSSFVTFCPSLRCWLFPFCPQP